MTTPHVVIVGAGAAGTAAATELTRLGFEGEITVVNAESVQPYNRTAVNKMLLQPNAQFASVCTPMSADRTTVLHARAHLLETQRRIVHLDGHRHLSYDALIVATGARPNLLPAAARRGPRPDPRITPLRTHSDAQRIRTVLDQTADNANRPARIAIAGASLLGAETADSLQSQGHEVYLTDAQPNPLQRLLGSHVAAWVEEQHRHHLAGLFREAVRSVESTDTQVRVDLSDGTHLGADLLVETLGVTPDVAWLAGCALEISDGVVVDDRLRAKGVNQVYAAGDLARVDGSPRFEHWGHALSHGTHAARALMHDLGIGDDPGPFTPTGSYSTWLYGKSINVIGSPDTRDREVTLATQLDGTHVSAYHTIDNRLTGAVVLGSAKAANQLRPLVSGGADLDDAIEVVG